MVACHSMVTEAFDDCHYCFDVLCDAIARRTMSKVFVVEDDASLREELARLLDLQGFTCETTVEYDAAVDDIIAAAPDCVILDLKLPGVSGHAICRGLRTRSDVPVIMLTSSDSEFDELMSMNLGADDFIAKPYNTQILLARISSILRRTQGGGGSQRISHKGVTLDLSSATAEFDGKSCELTKNEVRILYLLMKQNGTIIKREEIMNELWQSDEFVDDNTLTVNINRLRKKLEDIGVTDYLITKRGQGYLV